MKSPSHTLHRLRKHYKLHLRQVAKQTGVSVSLLSKIEKGSRKVTPTLAAKLMQVFPGTSYFDWIKFPKVKT